MVVGIPIAIGSDGWSILSNFGTFLLCCCAWVARFAEFNKQTLKRTSKMNWICSTSFCIPATIQVDVIKYLSYSTMYTSLFSFSLTRPIYCSSPITQVMIMMIRWWRKFSCIHSHGAWTSPCDWQHRPRWKGLLVGSYHIHIDGDGIEVFGIIGSIGCH